MNHDIFQLYIHTTRVTTSISSEVFEKKNRKSKKKVIKPKKVDNRTK